MTRVRYSITIHIARTNKLRLDKRDLVYKNIPAKATPDHLRFYQQKILLHCVRNSKRLSIDDILEYKQNTIYAQIYKSLLYFYLGNGRRATIRSIEVCTARTRARRDIDYKNQPLSNDFHLAKAIPDYVLLHLFDETPKGDNLRTVASHFLRAISSKDRYFKYERLWRAFEQLAFRHKYGDELSNTKQPKDYDAMCEMRGLILSHPAYFEDSLSIIQTLGKRKIERLHWRQLIETNYSYSGKIGELDFLIDNLMRSNVDKRLCGVFAKAKEIRLAGLRNHGLIGDVESIIDDYRVRNVKNDSQVLALLLCKYCYFMRNKMFHGEEADFTFCFTNHTEDDDITDFLNDLLEKTVIDLMCNYNAL